MVRVKTNFFLNIYWHHIRNFTCYLNLHNNSMKKYSFSRFTNDETEVQLWHVTFDYETTDMSIHSSASAGLQINTLCPPLVHHV